jgi:xylulokinase
MHHDRGNLTRAVLEGVAFNLYSGLRAFTENGIQVSSVDAIGGAARAGLLLRVFADVWGVPVASRELMDEATSIGASVVGGVGVGIFDGFDVAVRSSDRLPAREPDAGRHEMYLDRYAEFVDAYARLEPWFDSLR